MPPEVAVIVTPDVEPIPFTSPVELTFAHGVELLHPADLVMSFVPLLNVAVAVNCTELPTCTDKVGAPPWVTEIEFG